MRPSHAAATCAVIVAGALAIFPLVIRAVGAGRRMAEAVAGAPGALVVGVSAAAAVTGIVIAARGSDDPRRAAEAVTGVAASILGLVSTAVWWFLAFPTKGACPP